MDTSLLYHLAADVILILHVSIAAFVVFGLLLILLGKFRRWSWIRNPGFRIAHAAAIGVITLQSWLGIHCPLTILEKLLRADAGSAVYSGSFVAHMLGNILYYRLPEWVFVACYSAFFVAVVACWIWVRPRPLTRYSRDAER